MRLFPHPSFGILEISGPDAAKLLQGQLTCDVLGLRHGQSTLGAHCQPQGRILSLFYLLSLNDVFYLILPKNLIATALNALKKYAIFYKTSLNEVSDQWIIAGLFDETIPTNTPTSLIATIPIDQTRRLLIAPPNLLNPFFVDADKTKALIAAWQLANIEAKLPVIYPETSGLFLPHELDLHTHRAISFDKGCFTGQEIIARIHYRGKTKNHLFYALLNLSATTRFLPTPGQAVLRQGSEQSTVCGHVVDACLKTENTVATLLLLEGSHADSKHLYLDHHPEMNWQVIN